MRDRAILTLVCAVVLAVVLAVGAPTALEAQEPTTPQEALQHYEGLVGDWGDGPVRYLLTDTEEDVWEDLESDAQRQAFKRWFWERRDPDLRAEGNPFQEVFYTRVAEANERFRGGGVFRGWESDRGRAWIVLGRPDGMRPNMGLRVDSEGWTYYTVARDRAFETVFGEFHILFVQTEPAGGYEVYDSFAGVGIWPSEVLRAFEYTRNAYVVNPDLEMPAEIEVETAR